MVTIRVNEAPPPYTLGTSSDDRDIGLQNIHVQNHSLQRIITKRDDFEKMRVFGTYALISTTSASGNNGMKLTFIKESNYFITASDDGIERAGKQGFTPDRNNPPQFYLPGSLTPADVTKWGSGCWKHCWEGFSGRCKLCGSTACRQAVFRKRTKNLILFKNCATRVRMSSI